jgi:hypothetical protein
MQGKNKLQSPTANFVSYQRGMYYASIKTFDALPTPISIQVTNKNCFNGNLKTFLLDKPSNQVKNILTCVQGMSIEFVLSMRFMEFIV